MLSTSRCTLHACLFIGLVLSLSASVAQAQDKAAAIDALLQRYHDLGQLNGVALVAENGKILYKKGFGDAVMEWGVPNTPDTRFRIGSVTKQFTASLILQLVEEGQLSLDDTIAEILPDYPTSQGGKVTIHHLLTHTSGIPSYTSLPEFWNDLMRRPYTPDSFITVFADRDLEFEPGSQFRYNNSGYFLLGVIIEKVTGQPYDEVLDERLLQPLGLTDTGYDHFAEVIERGALGYVKTPGGYENAAYLDTSLPYAAGMMYSTVEDLFKWDRALYAGNVFDDPATQEQMFTPFLNNYAYGWAVHDLVLGDSAKTVKVVEHGGGINGFSTAFMRFVDDEHTVVVMDNTAGNAERVAHGLAHLLYDLPAPEPKPSIAEVLQKTISEQGIEAAVDQYHTLKENEPDAYNLAEPELNRLGYYYLNQDNTEAAIAVFKLNVEAYPEGFNTYDSLGEAYMKAGDEELAIKNYKKSLELNPANENARQMLKRMGVEVPQPESPEPTAQ